MLNKKFLLVWENFCIRKLGFTLAEVLITLGIIGVVAALTMPSIINKYQKEILRNQFKKAYSEISQATELLKVKEDINIFEYAKANNSQKALDKLMTQIKGAEVLEGSRSTTDFAKSFYAPKGLNKKGLTGEYCDNTNVYRGSNGIFYSMDDRTTNSSIADPKLCIDINGKSLPNSLGYDLFVFIFTPDGNLVPFTYEWTVEQTINTLDDISTQCSYNKPRKAFSCSYYALSDTSPEDSSKSYWKNFLK